MTVANYKIAVIPGDGIGKEVMPEGVKVISAAAEKFGIVLEWVWFDFASADYYQQHGKMLPDDWVALLKPFDAIYFGAVGWPEIVPDHVSLWGSLLQFRRQFDQYVNLRPVRLLAGIKSPLADRQLVTSISTWCVRIPKANTPALAERCFPIRTEKLLFRKR